MASSNRRVRQLAALAEQFPQYFGYHFNKEYDNAGIASQVAQAQAAIDNEEAAEAEATAAAERERQRRFLKSGSSLSGQAQIRPRATACNARQNSNGLSQG